MRIRAVERATLMEEKRIADKIRAMLRSESSLVSIADARWLILNVIGGIAYLIPTMFMYVFYILVLGLFLVVLDVRWDVVVCAILIGNYPVSCPKKWERVMRLLIPAHILYPAHFDKDGPRARPTSALSDFAEFDSMRNNLPRQNSERSVGSEDSDTAFLGTNTAADAGAEQSKRARPNLSGVWKRTSTVDYDKFLLAQGATWVKARLATSIALTHTVTMDKDLRYFRLAEKGGPIDTDQLYSADGKTVHRTNISEAAFDDTVYHDDDDALVVKKVIVTKDNKPLPPDKQYTLYVKRILDDDSHLRIIGDVSPGQRPEQEHNCNLLLRKDWTQSQARGGGSACCIHHDCWGD